MKSILMTCVVGLMMLVLAGAEPVKPEGKPVALQISYRFYQPMSQPTAGMKGGYPMVLEITNNGKEEIKVAKAIEIDPVLPGKKPAATKKKNEKICIRVICELPEGPGTAQLPANFNPAKDDPKSEKIEPGKSNLFRFQVPGMLFVAKGTYQLKAEVINSDQFPGSEASAVVKVECVGTGGSRGEGKVNSGWIKLMKNAADWQEDARPYVAPTTSSAI